jgi:hypothetical protein
MVVHATGTTANTGSAAGAVEADFPGWRVWRARDRQGRPASWWASRRHAAVWAEPQTLAGDTEAQLRAALDAAAASTAAPAL